MILSRPTGADLRTAWQEYRERNPRARTRDAADDLGVSEAELIATDCGESVTRLEGDWSALVRRFGTLGHVMALTRNDHAVHEKKGVYENISSEGAMGLVLGGPIDLRLFFSHWHHGFAVRDEAPAGGPRISLHFFDADGTAIHKVYSTESSDLEAFDEIIATFASPNQSQVLETLRPGHPESERPDSEIDLDGFQSAWRALQDTHDFFRLLNDFGVTRTQGLRLAPPELAYPVALSSMRQILEQAASAGNEIMVFVASPGVVQIHTGPVRNIKVLGNWLNVLDPDFNLHLREDRIAAAWIVKKPTADGIVTSLELFDERGRNIALIFGKRKPGNPELVSWRELVSMLARLETT